MRRDGETDPLAEGLARLDGYLDHLGLDTGVLVVFDRRRPDRQDRGILLASDQKRHTFMATTPAILGASPTGLRQ